MDGTVVRHVNPRLLHVLEFLDDTHFRLSRFMGRLLGRGDKNVYKTIDSYKARKKPKLIVHRAMHKVRRKSVEKIVEPCEGIYAVLDILSTNNVALCLVSNGLGKGYGHDILKKFGLDRYFHVSVFREDLSHSKPNPESILLALKDLRREITREDIVWYIGDRHKDISAALAAQPHTPCRIFPVAYGLHAALAALDKNLTAEHIYMSYYDMYETLIGQLDGAALESRSHQNLSVV